LDINLDSKLLNDVQQGLKFGMLSTYVPHPEQAKFHALTGTPERWFLAGNRSGKTYCECIEDIWWVTGTHPCFQPIAERNRDDIFWRNMRLTWNQRYAEGQLLATDEDRRKEGLTDAWKNPPEPEDWPYVEYPWQGQVAWRAVCTDNDIIIKVFIPIYQKMIPKDMLACSNCNTKRGGPGHSHNPSWDDAFNKTSGMIQFSEKYNNSFLEIKTYQQFKNNPYSHDSATLHGVHFDEEPPKDCYIVNKARMVTTGGPTLGSLTPVNSSAWIVEDLVEDSKDNPKKVVLEMEIWDNPFNIREVTEEWLSSIGDPAERLSRELGIPGYMQNKIYPMYKKDIHFIPRLRPFTDRLPEMCKVLSIDPHDSKPHAVNWGAWDVQTPKPTLYIYRELAMNGTASQLCKRIHAESAGEDIVLRLIDRSIRRTQQLLNEDAAIDRILMDFQEWFPDIIPVGGKGTYDIRVETVREMLLPDSATGLPRLFVMDDCPVTDWQMRHIHKKGKLPSGEDRPYTQKVKSKDDHADNVEYIAFIGPIDTIDTAKEQVVAGAPSLIPTDGSQRLF